MKYTQIWQMLKGRKGVTGPPQKENDRRITGMNTQKEHEHEEFQIREEEDNRRRQAQQDLERANERLAESQAQLAKLRAEYATLSERIHMAEWQFQQGLRAFALAKSRVVDVPLSS